MLDFLASVYEKTVMSYSALLNILQLRFVVAFHKLPQKIFCTKETSYDKMIQRMICSVSVHYKLLIFYIMLLVVHPKDTNNNNNNKK